MRIGELDEAIFFSTEIWSPSDYIRHWRAASLLVLEGETALFCTDLNRKSANIFCGFPLTEEIEFEEWIVPRVRLRVDGDQLKVTSHARSQEASRWRVSKGAVQIFAST